MYGSKENKYSLLSKKIKELFHVIKKDSLFKLSGFEWKDLEWYDDEKEVILWIM